MITGPQPAPEPTAARALPDHPRLESFAAEADALADGAGEQRGIGDTGARNAVARSYGFADWPALADRIWLIDRLSRWPAPAEPTDDGVEAISDSARLASRFCRLGTLGWTGADADGPGRARSLLERAPWLAGSDVYTLALTGGADALAALVADDPQAVRREGGPHDWPPLLYLCYGRVGGPSGSAVASARVLLDAGADPNSGFLWHGRLSPFTALTGVFGGGPEQPPHPEAGALAELLLERGADPNDHQALLHRAGGAEDDHLRLLLRYGLGRPHPSSWRERLGDHYPDGATMAGQQLRAAAARGLVDRVQLLLDHDVPPDGPPGRPVTIRVAGSATPYRLAVLAGHADAAALLAGAGADTGAADEVDVLTGRLGAGDGMAATLALEGRPELAEQARARFPQAVALAAEFGRLGGLLLLLAVGFDASYAQPDGRTALHHAARSGHLAMVQALLDHGADPGVRDTAGAAPADWARRAGHDQLAAELDALTP